MKQTTTEFEFTVDNIAKWLKDSTNWLIDHQEGCCTLKLDDRLAICVGWSDGFGDESKQSTISITRLLQGLKFGHPTICAPITTGLTSRIAKTAMCTMTRMQLPKMKTSTGWRMR